MIVVDHIIRPGIGVLLTSTTGGQEDEAGGHYEPTRSGSEDSLHRELLVTVEMVGIGSRNTPRRGQTQTIIISSADGPCKSNVDFANAKRHEGSGRWTISQTTPTSRSG